MKPVDSDILSDSSGNGYDFSSASSWTLGGDGVFGTSADPSTTEVKANIASLEGQTTYTVEFWLNKKSSMHMAARNGTRNSLL